MCICCRKRSSRGTQILTRRSQSALGFGTASWAAQNGHLHILEYLVERKFDQYDELRVDAAEYGHLDCLKYLHETAKAPWDFRAVRERTRTTTPNVYNTSSTTTVHYHMVGDTNDGEHYTTTRNNRRGSIQHRTARSEKGETASVLDRAKYAKIAERQIHRYGARNSSELKSRETHVQKAKRKPVITPTSHVITNRNTIGAQRGLISLC